MSEERGSRKCHSCGAVHTPDPVGIYSGTCIAILRSQLAASSERVKALEKASEQVLVWSEGVELGSELAGALDNLCAALSSLRESKEAGHGE